MSNHINIQCFTCSTEERQTRRRPAARRRGKQGDVLQHGGEANKETSCSTEERQTRRHPAARRRGKQGDILQHGGEANKETSPSKQI
ncbi:hypothetical protein CesoFtcFv8_004360 [Champsocephalus esox]|uniref:Uncharacterized protein n=1 Tax=Champsocephalus esox TaxID=159716 RepID=A0AAN8CV05_9TELE|nr:hypothetical protein CesoFtcFv8_004360 [Champsocephalus esox]